MWGRKIVRPERHVTIYRQSAEPCVWSRKILRPYLKSQPLKCQLLSGIDTGRQ